jgi:O-acetylhomoserine (thiol)-lyase
MAPNYNFFSIEHALWFPFRSVVFSFFVLEHSQQVSLGDYANNLYGGTYQLFHYTFPKLGRTVRFVDSAKPSEFKNAITSKTRAVYSETVGNPKLDVPDFEAIATVAHEAGIPLVVDNTVGVGLVRPIDFGADITVL